MAKEKKEEKKPEDLSSRLFSIMQYEKHPDTGEVLMTESQIERALEKYKSIKEWAWICHDRDVYTAEDESKDSKHKAGTLKPKHFHIELRFSSAYEVGQIARWFDVPVNFVKIPKGGNKAFTDKVEYLTHEEEKQQFLGKTLYNDSEVHSNFDFRELIKSKYLKQIEKIEMGIFKDDDEKYMCLVMYKGMTYNELKAEAPIWLGKNLQKYEKWRKAYLTKNAPIPHHRSNFYICGDGGDGKGYLSRALARTLCPCISDDRELFFEVGAQNVSFDGYDGQPVIIWSDFRAYELLDALGGRGNVFDVFDTTPTGRAQNIKYGSVIPINIINIVNSVQPVGEFLDGLAGEYVNSSGSLIKSEEHQKRQSYRRFQWTGVLRESDFELYINSGYLRKGSYFDYESVCNYKFKLKNLIEETGSDEKVITAVISSHAKALKSKFDELTEKHELTEEEKQAIMEKYNRIQAGTWTESERTIIDAEYEEVKQEELTEEEKATLPF